MIRSTIRLKRTVAAVATASVAAAILVPSASAFWLGGGLQYGSTPTTSTGSSVTKAKAVEKKIETGKMQHIPTEV
jgi:hypothetical protein